MLLRHGTVVLAVLFLLTSSWGSAGNAASPGPAEIWHNSRLVGFAQVAEDGQVTVVAGTRADGATLVPAGPTGQFLAVLSSEAAAPLIVEARALLGDGVLVVDGPEQFAMIPEEKRRVVLALDNPSAIVESLPPDALLICTLEAYAAMRGLEAVAHHVSTPPSWRFTKPAPWMGRIPEGSTMPWFGGEPEAYVYRSLGKKPALPENAVVRAVSAVDGGPVLIEEPGGNGTARVVALDLQSPDNAPGHDAGSINKWTFVTRLIDKRPHYGVYVPSKPTFDEYMGWYAALGERFPGKLNVKQVGTGSAGDPVMSVRLGKRGAPRFILLGCLHGAEIMPAYGLFYLAELLLENPDKDPRIDWLLGEFEVEILPVVNAWGYTRGAQVNSRDVDLNRNFPYKWEQYKGDGGWRERYGVELRGKAPFSEGEAAAVRDRVLDGNVAGFADFHQHGRQHGNMMMISEEPLQQQHDAFVFLHRLLNARMAGRYLQGSDQPMAIRLNSRYAGSRPLARNWVSTLGIPACVFELVGGHEDSLLITDLVIHKSLDLMWVMGMRHRAAEDAEGAAPFSRR